MKKIIIFLYIIIILWTIIIIQIPIKEINILPKKTMVLKKFHKYINKPMVLLNNGVVEKNILLTSRFYSSVKTQWNFNGNQLNIYYEYQKPSVFYKNSIITSFGKQLHYESALLLPVLDNSVDKNMAIVIGSTLSKKFSIKLVESIKFENYQWIMIMRNGQIWYCSYSWNKFLNNLKGFSKKEIKTIINYGYGKVFVGKNALLVQNK